MGWHSMIFLPEQKYSKQKAEIMIHSSIELPTGLFKQFNLFVSKFLSLTMNYSLTCAVCHKLQLTQYYSNAFIYPSKKTIIDYHHFSIAHSENVTSKQTPSSPIPSINNPSSHKCGVIDFR